MSDIPLLQLPNTFRAFYGAFSSLHKVQIEAINPILRGKDLIIQASTGAGKSEAVLAPCLELIINSNSKIALLYIIPTKALAMDLKRRFESIINERLGLNLAIRTGDIKHSGGKRPDIMFTTPESLDVMLGSSNADLKSFLYRVEIVVIDEVHHLIHQYRGRHLVYLLTRLERKRGKLIQKIAMSATIDRVRSVIDFFKFQNDTEHIVTDVKRDIAARLVQIKQEESEIPALLNDLYSTWHYRKILIFANSRATCDRLFSIINRMELFQGVLELHYSNLKPRERNSAEKRFRKNSFALCIATSTLELGIDVGDIDAILLYEPPGSISTFLQRIGRSNRRENKINFWGICSGESSGNQVLRFLALLELSNTGLIESPDNRTLPSVLSQQVISCLYEKKQITLKSLLSLFPDQSEFLPSIFESLQKKNWLKKSKTDGLIRGGWQYRNHLFDYKIWSNFPKAEEKYVLIVSDKAIADIPQSIVSQMEVGDTLYIAGRLLRILKIDTTDKKNVFAKPSTGKEEKQLVWIGMGPFVSFEVAQVIGEILKKGTSENLTCLFTRTKKLFFREIRQKEQKLVLENGIEIVTGRHAPFRYLTFLGSAANLILEWSIREKYCDDDIFISSDEISLECSFLIKFEDLQLPVNSKEFLVWIKKHFKILASLIPLNLFSNTLPKHLLIQEISEFFFDHRIMYKFIHYHKSSSRIISGNKQDLVCWGRPVTNNSKPIAIKIFTHDSLLDREKAKKNNYAEFSKLLNTDTCSQICVTPDKPVIVTASMISDYFFYAQCQRRFCFKFLGLNSSDQHNSELKNIFIDRGKKHKNNVLKELQKQGTKIVCLETAISQEMRFKTFLEKLNSYIVTATSSNSSNERSVFLSQCLLKADLTGQKNLKINGIGIPDLLCLSLKKVNGQDRVVIEVGDIKSSPSPYYHHKWQVAFYTLLLQKIIASHEIQATIADTAFLINSSFDDFLHYEKHRFELKAYLSAFPMIFHTISTFLSKPASFADHRLQHRCTNCDFFSYCYYNVLEKETIQLLPQLSPGKLFKLRQIGCTSIAQIQIKLEKMSSKDIQKKELSEPVFDLKDKEQLLGYYNAFKDNCIFLCKKKTWLFPNNISNVMFIHLENDLLTGQPFALGWQISDSSGKSIKSHVWIMENNQEREQAWQEFASLVSSLWEKSIVNGKGPHIFHFSSKVKQNILQWGKTQNVKKPDFLWQTQPSPWTDLKKLFETHFIMPIPGLVSLFALGHIFACTNNMDQPQTLFHYNKTDGITFHKPESMIKSSLSIMNQLYIKACYYLKSQWNQEWYTDSKKDARLLSYLRFIKEEQRLHEITIVTLQEQTLQERVSQLRAIGNLKFDKTKLDHEGRYLYVFNLTAKTYPNKFRKGDFLKLAYHGISDVQDGFSVIMAEYNIDAGILSLLSRSGKMHLNKNFLYSLEEDSSDYNLPKLIHVVNTVFKEKRNPVIQQLLAGRALERQPCESLTWLKNWLNQNNFGLNSSQQKALSLPFKYRTSLIQGPPGTGKTHLLAWILITLILSAHKAGRPLRIGVSALTHQAIDTVLKKVHQLVTLYLSNSFPGHYIKWGKASQTVEVKADEKIEFSEDAEYVLKHCWLILGATGYGFYNLFNGKNREPPETLDWVVFDEASQITIPYALLSLIYGKGNFLFLGDVNQLPPIVLGDYNNHREGFADVSFNQSILSNFLALYPDSYQETLNITYRMNKELCYFPSKTWYKNMLRPASYNTTTRYTLNNTLDKTASTSELTYEYVKILDPEKPVVLVVTDHKGCYQKSDVEADLIVFLAHKLLVLNNISPDQIAIISPYRAQNNTILKKLEEITPDKKLPLVDTVERIQGEERDVIIFGITCSNIDHVQSDFLNSPNRLNVAMTRAKTKLIIIASKIFYYTIPDSERILIKNSCFKQLFNYCKKQNTVMYC